MAEKIEIIAELKDLVSSHIKDINAQIDKMDAKLTSVGNKGLGGGGAAGITGTAQGGIMGQVLGANLLTGAITKAAGAVYDFGKDSLDSYGRQEQFLVSLRTMFQGNEKEAESLNERLMTLAKTTPFELTEIQDATKMMIAYGSTSGSVVDELRMLGDVSSGVGSSVKEIAYLYGTLKTQGVAHTVDIRQFAGRGIPIIKELAKQFGVTEKQVSKLVEEGKVGFKEIEKAFQSMTNEGGQFFNMMSEQSKTQVGQLSNLSDAWDQFKVSIGENLSETFKGAMAILNDGISEATNLMQDYNKTAKTLEKSGVGFKWTESNNTRAELSGFTGYLKRVTEFAGRGDSENAQAKRGLEEYSKSLSKQYKDESLLAEVNGESGPDAQKYLRQIALLKDTIASIDQISKSNKAEKDKEKANEPKKLETLAKANKPTQTIINIENLVRELSNVFQNDKPGFDASLTTMMEAVSKTLIAAVNDISVLGQN